MVILKRPSPGSSSMQSVTSSGAHGSGISAVTVKLVTSRSTALGGSSRSWDCSRTVAGLGSGASGKKLSS